MANLHILRPILRYAPIAIAVVGIGAAVALGWFCYRYIYQTITTAHASVLLQPPLVVELIDPKRIESADAFLQRTTALPPIDPSTIRDVFSAPTPKSALPVDGRPKP
ncbi:MAG: hypothetical protein Q7S02_03020 [bacterium]|nr:hypothetical protein [bacterium]